VVLLVLTAVPPSSADPTRPVKKSKARKTSKTSKRVTKAKARRAITPEDQQYNFNKINDYRRTVGVAPLVLDPKISDFALEGSKQLSMDHVYHKHNNFRYWETQGYNYGTPIPGWPNSPNVSSAIDTILDAMWKEPASPPGTSPNAYNHHDIMASPLFKRVGVGLFIDEANGTLYLTNDFSKSVTGETRPKRLVRHGLKRRTRPSRRGTP
jgi:hypothetical protein